MPKTSFANSSRSVLSSISRLLLKIPVQLAILLLLMTLLRLPNFAEPYWYGDEAIYLTIGQALNDGQVLYQDIIDHKTPIIYYLARADSQLNFRVLFYFWMLMTTTAWYFVARNLWRSTAGAAFGGFFFVLLTSLPWFEGHIPNGELFVMGFVLFGVLVLQKTKYWQQLMAKKSTNQSKNTRPWVEPALLISASGLLSLAVLTKVPAIFDYAAIAVIGWLILVNKITLKKQKFHAWLQLLLSVLKAELWLLVGLVIPILASILYFVAVGAGHAYLDYGLLYNFRYAGNWDLGLSQSWLAFWFTLPGKLVFLLFLLAGLSVIGKRMHQPLQWLIMWSGLALVASLLSNRPYPHYFMQVVPPFTLMVAGVGSALLTKKRSVATILFRSGITLAMVSLFIGLMVVMKIAPYSTKDYYQDYWHFLTGNFSQAEYYQSFNSMMFDNYQAAAYLKSLPGDTLFIWGTNPMLYALSERHPVGRFTVAFHIHDFDAYEETMQHIITEQPAAIVVMNNESVPLPGLDNYLSENYRLVNLYEHFTLWQNRSLDR